MAQQVESQGGNSQCPLKAFEDFNMPFKMKSSNSHELFKFFIIKKFMSKMVIIVVSALKNQCSKGLEMPRELEQI